MFADLVKRCNWKNVKTQIRTLYPDQISSLNAYKDVFDYIVSQENIVPGECFISLEKSWDDFNVYIIENDEKFFFGGHWNDFISYYVNSETLEKFSEDEIVARCLWEITFFGFEPDSALNI